MSDSVIAPAHYTAYSPMQPIEVCRLLSFNLGNAVKYACRAPFKGGTEDIDKAIRYLEIEEDATRGELDFNLGQRKIICRALAGFSAQVLKQENLLPSYRRGLAIFLDLLNCQVGLDCLTPLLREKLADLKNALAAN